MIRLASIDVVCFLCPNEIMRLAFVVTGCVQCLLWEIKEFSEREPVNIVSVVEGQCSVVIGRN